MSTDSPDINNSRTADRTAVKTTIKAHPGHENAISSERIGEIVGLSATTVRDIVQELLADGCLIGSCPAGYYYIATTAEFRREMASLESQKEQTRRRMQELSEKWYSTGGDQSASG